MGNAHGEKAGTPTARNNELLDRRIDRAKYVFELVNGWIENADAKVGTSCGLFAGVFGAFTFLSECLVETPDPSAQVVVDKFWSCMHMAALVTGSICFLVAVCFYAAAITPNLKSAAQGRDRRHFPLYYGDIADVSGEEFCRCMHHAQDAAFLDEVAREAHHNARVCTRKMKRYRIAVLLSTGAVSFVILSWIAHSLMYVK